MAKKILSDSELSGKRPGEEIAELRERIEAAIVDPDIADLFQLLLNRIERLEERI